MALVKLSGQGEPLRDLPQLPLPIQNNDIIPIYRNGGDLLSQTSASVILNINFAFEYLGSIIPSSLEVMGAVIFPVPVKIPTNFLGSYGAIITNPTETFVITVNHNGSAVGTITVSTAGAYTFATTSGDAIVFAAGDTLTFIAPSSVDVTAEDFFFTIVATRD